MLQQAARELLQLISGTSPVQKETLQVFRRARLRASGVLDEARYSTAPSLTSRSAVLCCAVRAERSGALAASFFFAVARVSGDCPRLLRALGCAPLSTSS